MASDDVLDRERLASMLAQDADDPSHLRTVILAHDAALRERTAELEEALEGLVAEVDDRPYKEGCKCDWCGSIRRARRALDKGEDDG